MAIALNIGIELVGIRLRFQYLGLCSLCLFLGGGHAGLGRVHIGAGGTDLAERANTGNRDPKLCCFRLRLRVLVVGLRTRQRNLVIGGVDLHQHIAFAHELAVVIVHLGHLATHSGTDRVDVAVNLRVIGAFPVTALPPEPTR